MSPELVVIFFRGVEATCLVKPSETREVGNISPIVAPTPSRKALPICAPKLLKIGNAALPPLAYCLWWFES